MRGVRFENDPDVLRWNATSGADYYDVRRGLLSQLDGEKFGTCLANDLAAFEIEDPDAVPTGDGYFYVVRADDAVCGPGPAAPAGTGERFMGPYGACP